MTALYVAHTHRCGDLVVYEIDGEGEGFAMLALSEVAYYPCVWCGGEGSTPLDRDTQVIFDDPPMAPGTIVRAVLAQSVFARPQVEADAD